jgi:uncharacterized protein YndB with AHSA1/START domain
MTATTTPAEFNISRVFDAPRELVWKVWTQTEHLEHWWGPKGCTLQVKELDFRPGGVFLYCMQVPEVGQMWGKWVYREIVEPEKFSYISSFADENGNTIRAPFSSMFPLEVLSTLTISQHEGRTTLTMHAVPIDTSEAEQQLFQSMHSSMQQGWGGTLDQLAAYLAGSAS